MYTNLSYWLKRYTKVISLKAKKYMIIGGVAAGASLVLVFNLWLNSVEKRAYQKGVDETVALYKEAEQKYLLERAEKDAEIIRQDSVEEIIIEREVVKTVVEVQKVIEYVDREIEVVVGCEKLASDIVRMRSTATDIINSAARREDP